MKRKWIWPAATVVTAFIVGVVMRDVETATWMSVGIAIGTLVREGAGRLLRRKS